MRKIISIMVALVMILSLVSCGNTQKANWSEHLEAGQKFLLDGNYEQAIIEFNKVIEIEPRNVDAYLGLADAYVAQGDYEKAIEVLEKGYAETQSSEIQRRINELKGILSPQTEVTEQTEPPVTTVTEATTEVTTTKATTTEATTLPEPDPVAEDFAWTFEDGVLTISGHGSMLDYSAFERAPWYDINRDIKQVFIENGITSIGNNSFIGCHNLTSITMPNSVISIGYASFAYCYSLTSITIPDSVVIIGNEAFNYCTKLTEVTIPDSVISIGYASFAYCYSLTSITIPDSVTSIEGKAFYDCGLTSITIPDSVKYIGWGAFCGCGRLTNITLSNNITSIESQTFYGCASLTSVAIPNSVISIGERAFSYCSSLTSITISESVASIGYWSFENCYNLSSITIPYSVTSIDNAFTFCDSLTDIYCEAESKPAGWGDDWNKTNATVHWGYKG